MVVAVKTCLPTQELQELHVRFLGSEDPLEEETATHSRTLAWKIPQTGEPGGLQDTTEQLSRAQHRGLWVELEIKYETMLNTFVGTTVGI